MWCMCSLSFLIIHHYTEHMPSVPVSSGLNTVEHNSFNIIHTLKSGGFLGMHIIVSVTSCQSSKCLEMTPYVNIHVQLSTSDTSLWSVAKVNIFKLDVRNMMPLPNPLSRKLQSECVKRFNLNLLVWVGQEWGLMFTTKVSKSCSDIKRDDTAGVIRPKYCEFDHFILNGLASKQ